jgi:hypothetical protein
LRALRHEPASAPVKLLLGWLEESALHDKVANLHVLQYGQLFHVCRLDKEFDQAHLLKQCRTEKQKTEEREQSASWQ